MQENDEIKQLNKEITEKARRRERAEANKQDATVSFQKQDYK